MNFSSHYFNNDKLVNEKLSDVVKDVAKGAVSGALGKAVVKGIGRAAANVLRGATGRTKTIAFEPNWLKIIKPVDLATYKDLINKYANWKTQKTKLGPKKNFTIIDNRDGRLGEFSKDNFIEIIGRFDKNLQQKLEALGDVKDLQNPKEVKIPMRIHVYIYNNGGKAIFMDIPTDEDGKKRAYVIGLDNKAERAFRQVHGMPFQDYELTTTGQVEKEKEEPKTAAEKGILKFKYEVPPDQYKKLIPKSGTKLSLAASYEYPTILDLFNEEVLSEKALEINGKRAVTIGKGGEWYRLTAKNKKIYSEPITSFKEDLIAVDRKGNPSEELQLQLDKDIERYKEEMKKKDEEEYLDKEKGQLFNDIKDELDPNNPPAKTKPSKKTKDGWRFILKNGGIIFIYQTIDDKNMIGFDDKAKKVVDSKDLINKYKLKVSEETPEIEAPE